VPMHACLPCAVLHAHGTVLTLFCFLSLPGFIIYMISKPSGRVSMAKLLSVLSSFLVFFSLADKLEKMLGHQVFSPLLSVSRTK
jgi:hypothetical protein